MTPDAETRVFALLGRPVGHSLSPAMHNAAFRALGINAVYVALDCAAPEVPGLMRALARSGGGNVTVPHKGVAGSVAAESATGAADPCNTFWGDPSDGSLRVANTDPEGVLHALARLGVETARWLVVGTGGSAHGVLLAARRAGAAIAVRSRQPERADEFRREAASLGVPVVQPEACDLVINATPLGLAAGDPLPLPLADAPSARAVLDLVYARGTTPLVQQARARGLPAADGREVLVGQGAAAFRCWFPRHDPPVELMRAMVRDALG